MPRTLTLALALLLSLALAQATRPRVADEPFVAIGGSVARSAAVRAGDVMDFLDLAGSDPTGTSQQSTALNNAFARAKAAGKGLLIPFGTFNLTGGSASLPTNVTLVFGPGVTWNTNGNYIDNTGDFSQFIGQQTSGAWMRSTDKPRTEFGTFTSLNVESTGASAAYEKGAAYFIAATADPSSYIALGDASNENRDVVGIQSSATISSRNLKGRAWGATMNCSVSSTSNGLCTGLEVDVTNDSGTDQPVVSTPTTKVGVTAVATGNTNSTDAFAALTGGARWHNGLDIFANAVIDNAIIVRSSTDANQSLANLDSSGNLFAQTLIAEGVNGGKMSSGASSSAVAQFTSLNGPLQLTASGSNTTYLGSGTSPVILQGGTFAASPINAQSDVNITGVLRLSVAGGIAAAGTSQATAKALSTDISVVTTVESGSGVLLTANIGQRQEVFNRGANTLLVYPARGAAIEANAANAFVSLAVGSHATFECVSATQCYQTP